MELLHWIAGPYLAQAADNQMVAFPALILGLVCLIVGVVGAVVLGVVLARSGRGANEVVQTCPYCGTHLRGRPVLQCTNCGATLGPPQQ
jgi:hypothetical protein